MNDSDLLPAVFAAMTFGFLLAFLICVGSNRGDFHELADGRVAVEYNTPGQGPFSTKTYIVDLDQEIEIGVGPVEIEEDQ